MKVRGDLEKIDWNLNQCFGSIKMSDKQEFTALLQEVFGMIEELQINEGQYLQFADLFKTMNLKVERLCEIKDIITYNQYYNRYIRGRQRLRRNQLSEAEKQKSPNYHLCECGRYICNKGGQLDHNHSLVHYQGLRNRKYARRGLPDHIITEQIDREVVLTAFCLKHIKK